MDYHQAQRLDLIPRVVKDLQRENLGASEMAQWVRMIATKPEILI